MAIEYKFNEENLINEIQEYIDETYEAHYSNGSIQSTEFIEDTGHGIGFTLGNILKYAQRYGKKGSAEDARKDLRKVVHYGIIALAIHDRQHQKSLEHPFCGTPDCCGECN